MKLELIYPANVNTEGGDVVQERENATFKQVLDNLN